ncbi:hypothetical protein OQA88_5796 [Cercophora sp. LCS_1]
MAPKQTTFTLVPNPLGVQGLIDRNPDDVVPSKPAMTSKQAQKLYKKANRVPRVSKEEQRRLDRIEQERIRKELEKDKQANKARILREKKRAKEQAALDARKKKGLPLVDVRPSQDTLARFFRGNGQGKKRDSGGLKVDEQNSRSATEEPSESETPPPPEKRPRPSQRSSQRSITAEEARYETTAPTAVVESPAQRESARSRVQTPKQAADLTTHVIGDRHQGARDIDMRMEASIAPELSVVPTPKGFVTAPAAGAAKAQPVNDKLNTEGELRPKPLEPTGLPNGRAPKTAPPATDVQTSAQLITAVPSVSEGTVGATSMPPTSETAKGPPDPEKRRSPRIRRSANPNANINPPRQQSPVPSTRLLVQKIPQTASPAQSTTAQSAAAPAVPAPIPKAPLKSAAPVAAPKPYKRDAILTTPAAASVVDPVIITPAITPKPPSRPVSRPDPKPAPAPAPVPTLMTVPKPHKQNASLPPPTAAPVNAPVTAPVVAAPVFAPKPAPRPAPAPPPIATQKPHRQDAIRTAAAAAPAAAPAVVRRAVTPKPPPRPVNRPDTGPAQARAPIAASKPPIAKPLIRSNAQPAPRPIPPQAPKPVHGPIRRVPPKYLPSPATPGVRPSGTANRTNTSVPKFLPRTGRPLAKPTPPVPLFNGVAAPTSTQLFLAAHIDEVLPTLTQEARELQEASTPVQPPTVPKFKKPPVPAFNAKSAPQPRRFIRQPAVANPPRPPPICDLGFLSTQDLTLSSQDIRDVEQTTETPSKVTNQIGGGHQFMHSNKKPQAQSNLPPIRKDTAVSELPRRNQAMSTPQSPALPTKHELGGCTMKETGVPAPSTLRTSSHPVASIDSPSDNRGRAPVISDPKPAPRAVGVKQSHAPAMPTKSKAPEPSSALALKGTHRQTQASATHEPSLPKLPAPGSAPGSSTDSEDRPHFFGSSGLGLTMMYAMADSIKTAEEEERRRQEERLKELEAHKENRAPQSSEKDAHHSMRTSQRREQVGTATIGVGRKCGQPLRQSLNHLGLGNIDESTADKQTLPDISTQETDYGDFDIGTQDLGDLRRYF